MTVEVDSTSTYGMINISVSNFDKSIDKHILSIDIVNNSKELHIDTNDDDYETIDIYRTLT